jgi:hypothetical protein
MASRQFRHRLRRSALTRLSRTSGHHTAVGWWPIQCLKWVIRYPGGQESTLSDVYLAPKATDNRLETARREGPSEAEKLRANFRACRGGADLNPLGRAHRAVEVPRRPVSQLAHLREALDRAPQPLRRIAR